MSALKDMMIGVQEMIDDGMRPEKVATMYGISVEDVYELLDAMNELDAEYEGGVLCL